MKRNKTISKYHKELLEDSAPICPICGEHTIKTEIEDVEYKIDGNIVTLKEEFFRCHKNPGEQYATDEMVKHSNNQLRGYFLKKELDKKRMSVTGFKRDIKL
jgi:YgiT-type zinc finger domain-containing protein